MDDQKMKQNQHNLSDAQVKYPCVTNTSLFRKSNLKAHFAVSLRVINNDLDMLKEIH